MTSHLSEQEASRLNIPQDKPKGKRQYAVGGMTRITLPFPPPLSACFTNVKGVGRVATSRYKSWQKNALKEIMAQRAKPVTGEVSISVGLVAPDRRARDAGNLDKALCDVLVKAGIIQDDSNKYVRRISYEWLADGEPVTILIQSVEAR